MNPGTAFTHDHNYQTSSQQNARKVSVVFALTVLTMVAEIAVGSWSGSMALLADGWHMGTHAAAFAIALFAYAYARRHAGDSAFSFGTGKVTYLGGFASAVALAAVALMMAIESLARLLSPQAIRFDEAMLVAGLGLAINVISAFILHQSHAHEHERESPGRHHDHNLRAAYFHVLADALTSVLAIVALGVGRYFGWLWLDALMGIVGAFIIGKWAWTLVAESGAVLLDKSTVDLPTLKANIEAQHAVEVCDLHVWTVAQHHQAAILSVVAKASVDAQQLKRAMHQWIPHLAHVTVEVQSRS